MGNMYSAEFNAVAIAEARDLFEIVAPSTRSVVIHGWVFGQTTDYGDAQAEGARIQLIRGHSTSGSGGATPTPAPLGSGTAAASSTVESVNTTLASTGSPVTLFSDGFNIQIGHQFWFTPETRPVVPPSTRIVLRLPNTPADAYTSSGTIFFEEVG